MKKTFFELKEKIKFLENKINKIDEIEYNNKKNKIEENNKMIQLQNELQNNKKITIEIMKEKLQIIENIKCNIDKNYVRKQELHDYMFESQNKNNLVIDTKSDILFGLVEKLSNEISVIKKTKVQNNNEKTQQIENKIKSVSTENYKIEEISDKHNFTQMKINKQIKKTPSMK